MGTYLAFEGVIIGCKPVMAKQDEYGRGRAGSMEMTLVVDQPQQEKKPTLPYWMAAGADQPMTREQYEATLDADLTTLKRNESLDRYDKSLAGYTRELEAWQQRQGSFHERLRSYASLVGIAAVFGHQKLAVTLTPAEQDMFPGFELNLLPAPEGDAS